MDPGKGNSNGPANGVCAGKPGKGKLIIMSSRAEPPAAPAGATQNSPEAFDDGPPPQSKEEAQARIEQLIIAESVAITRELIEAAKKGSHLPAKFLFDLAHIEAPAMEDADAEREDSLAELLLRELGQAQPGPAV